jgi:hypothetical protein
VISEQAIPALESDAAQTDGSPWAMLPINPAV